MRTSLCEQFEVRWALPIQVSSLFDRELEKEKFVSDKVDRSTDVDHGSEVKTPSRRPIRSRDSRWARVVTDRLIRWRFSPNAISVAGMVGAMLAGVLLAATSSLDGIVERAAWIGIGLLCQFRLLCNLFDGMVAVDSGKASAVGELYNEVPDRISDVAIFVGLGYASFATPWLGWAAAVMVVFVPYVRMMAVSAGAPNDFCGPMAKPQRMALVTGLAVAMAVLPDWLQSVANKPHLSWVNLVLVIVVVGCCITSVRRLSRAAKWLRSRRG
ncbi:MAG: CDP-alcohol phosphatidyltransferase family protein [Pirellulales bacterium]